MTKTLGQQAPRNSREYYLQTAIRHAAGRFSYSSPLTREKRCEGQMLWL